MSNPKQPAIVLVAQIYLWNACPKGHVAARSTFWAGTWTVWRMVCPAAKKTLMLFFNWGQSIAF